MKIPVLPPLQFLVAFELMNGNQSGANLRKSLAKQGFKISLSAFYQLMSRLEESKFVKGEYLLKVEEAQTIKERQYELTPNGIAQVCLTQTFYARVKQFKI